MKIYKTANLYIEIILTIFVVCYALYRFQFSEEKHKISIEIFMSAIAISGMLIKIILGYIFPEIVLNNEGIKIFGRENIKWKEIEGIFVKQNGNKTLLNIQKHNRKIINPEFKNLNINPEKLQEILNSFMEKYGMFNYKK